MTKRTCFFIPPDAYVEGKGFVPSIVTENEPGHAPLVGNGDHSAPWYWGTTYEAAKEHAAKENERLGLTPEDVNLIIISSMRASNVVSDETAKPDWHDALGTIETMITDMSRDDRNDAIEALRSRFDEIYDREGPDDLNAGANTLIRYMYRDNDNYKEYAEVVFKGAITDDERAALVAAVGDEGLFEPDDVGLESARGWEDDDGHTTNELFPDEITVVERPPTDERTITEFVAALVAAQPITDPTTT